MLRLPEDAKGNCSRPSGYTTDELVKEGVSGRWVLPPANAMQAHLSCSEHAWVMCRGARLEASGLSRGAAQSPWFCPLEARKRNHARLGSTIHQDAGDPSPAALAEAHPAMHASCAWTFANAGTDREVNETHPKYIVRRAYLVQYSSFSTVQYTYLKPVALLSPLPPSPAWPPSASSRSSNLSNCLFSFTCTNRRTSARSATMRQMTVFAVPPGTYLGAAVDGYIYEP